MGKGKGNLGKTIVSLAGVAAALIVIAILLLMFQLGTVVKTAVEKVGPTVTGGPVTVSSVSIRPFTGKAVLKGLVIGNPAGYRTPNAFELAELNVDLNVRSIFGNPLVIHRVLIDGAQITYETAHGKGNLEAIMANVKKATPARKSKPAAPPAGTPPAPKPAKTETHVVIDRLVISHGRVAYASSRTGNQPVPLPLPTITMTDIGKDRPTTVSEAVSQIVGEILNGVGTAIAQSFTKSAKALKHGTERLKELGSESDAMSKGAAAGIGRAADDVAEAAHKGLQKLGLGDWVDKPPKQGD
ncbi:MAG: AsmA family protein [Lentisphaerae bacterium]|nr:AsmA family protein [Lentisphaerota bacterium]